MNGEIGHFALLLTLFISLWQFLLAFFYHNNINILSSIKRATYSIFILQNISFFSLIYAFLNDDFSIYYISNNSNSLLAWYYKISAIWAGHEGSLLLWLYSLSTWSALIAWKSANFPKLIMLKILAILAYIIFGFTIFIYLTSNPFLRQLPFPFDGKDLNPLLQDIGLILHPPLLYFGYVGFAVTFAIIAASLWQGRLDSICLKRARNWTLAAWITLTLGIALGSYWAYYELGWGGWWFWDPVENSSLMPWLIGCALLHSLIISQKRGLFTIWTATLAILAFSLSLIGTFLVRSGVLTSIHAFANDPTRGVFILSLLVIIILPALLLLIWRAPLLSNNFNYNFFSIEGSILINNFLFFSAFIVIFIGTLYPLLADVLNIGKISVGAPYFNKFIVPLALLSLLALAIIPIMRWQSFYKIIYRTLAMIISATFFTALIVFHFISELILYAFFTIFITLFALLGIVINYFDNIRIKNLKSLFGAASLNGMTIAHIGYVIMAFAIAMTSYYSDEKNIAIKRNQIVNIANYNIKLNNFSSYTAANYQAMIGEFIITRNDNKNYIAILKPEKRKYFSSNMPINESAILTKLTHDLYLAMGEKINDNTWAIRIQYKPFIIWIWLGAIIMAIGAAIAGFNRNYECKEI